MSKWIPIGSAPKDGTIVQLWRPAPANGFWQRRITAFFDREICAWVWPDSDRIDIEGRDRSWMDNGDFYEDDRSFTHWMPLPSPPAETQEDRQGEAA